AGPRPRRPHPPPPRRHRGARPVRHRPAFPEPAQLDLRRWRPSRRRLPGRPPHRPPNAAPGRLTMAQTTNAYDAIVIGARVAGAATAMLLARHGLRVLLVDRDRYGTDTLSTHALMRGSVFLLSRWGLLDRIVEAGTPPVRQTRFDYGTDSATVTIK